MKALLLKNVVIEKGKLKGKTPYQILVEDATNGIVDLKSQYNWLEKNAEKYPQNKQQMRAIVEALTMYQNGAIQQGDISAGDNYPLVQFLSILLPHVH